ncbi:MAG TPA: hypothetical protein VM325_06180, partial [Alphaproteobacteria bacterium]|nr:hypothetical protein [Alphaproteobacteria bacterium]
RLDNPPAQIQTVRTCHICLPINLGSQNHISNQLGIPRDSYFLEDALGEPEILVLAKAGFGDFGCEACDPGSIGR